MTKMIETTADKLLKQLPDSHPGGPGYENHQQAIRQLLVRYLEEVYRAGYDAGQLSEYMLHHDCLRYRYD